MKLVPQSIVVATIKASGSLPPLLAFRLAAISAILGVTGSVSKPLLVRSMKRFLVFFALFLVL